MNTLLTSQTNVAITIGLLTLFAMTAVFFAGYAYAMHVIANSFAGGCREKYLDKIADRVAGEIIRARIINLDRLTAQAERN